jgi:hypothetical protein
MRRVPFFAKFAVSTGIALYMCNKLWESNTYEAELYQVALRYREKYDKDWKPELEGQHGEEASSKM